MEVITATPQAEEQAARRAVREAAREERERAAERERREQSKLAGMIREELSTERAKSCKCGITPRMSRRDLIDLGAGCTSGRWVCPTLDAIRRRMDR